MLVSSLLTKPILKTTMQSTIKTSKTVLSLTLSTLLLISVSGCGIKQRPKEEPQKNDESILKKSTDEALIIEEPIVEQRIIDPEALAKKEADNQPTVSPPAIVEVMEVALKDISQTKDFSGIATSFETYEVHPKITGTVAKIDFKQGNWVKVGKPLYRIESQTIKSSVATKKATIKKATASLNLATSAHKKALAMLKKNRTELTQAKSDLNRYKKLIKDNAISKQKYQQTVSEVNKAQASIKITKALVNQTDANIKMAEADIELAKNQLEDDKKTLGLTVVKAPITGMVLDASIRKGQKVIAENADSFVTIAKVNPIYVDIQPTAEELVQIKEMLVSTKKITTKPKNKTNKKSEQKLEKASNKKPTSKDSKTDITSPTTPEITTPNVTDNMVKKHEVSLVLDNGTSFAHAGKFKFSETKIDNNNKITMRMVFPNNKGLLLPNMKVTAKVKMPSLKNVILLPITSVIHMPTKTANTIIGNLAERPKEPMKADNNNTKDKSADASKDKTANLAKDTPSEKTKDSKKDDSKENKVAKAQEVTKQPEVKTAKAPEVKKKVEKVTTKSQPEATPESQPLTDFAHFVYIVDENNQAQLRQVQVGGTSNDKIIVADGLLEGDKVIIDSNAKIVHRQAVVIKNKALPQDKKKDKKKS